MQVHGSHWMCLYKDLDAFADEQLPRLIEKQPLLHQFPWTNPKEIPPGENVDRLAIFCEQTGSVRHMVLVLGHSVLRTNFMYSAYPVAVDTVECNLRITKLQPWEHGIEGTVVAEIEDQADLTFFDPWFFLNRSRYRIGEVNRVRLAAFAYVAKPLDQEYVEITEPERAEELRKLLNMTEKEPVRFLMTDFVARIPREPEDDCEYSSPVKEVTKVSTNGLELRKAKIALVRGPDEDLDAPLYIASHNMPKSFDLRAGAMVQGIYWLQGYLAESHSLFLGH